MNRAANFLIARYNVFYVTIIGLLIGAVGLFILSFLNSETSYVIGLLPGLFILPAGASLVFSGSAVLSTANISMNQAGLAGGVMNTAMELGPTIGLAVLISISAVSTDVIDGYGLAFAAAGILYVLAAIVTLVVYRKN